MRENMILSGLAPYGKVNQTWLDWFLPNNIFHRMEKSILL